MARARHCIQADAGTGAKRFAWLLWLAVAVWAASAFADVDVLEERRSRLQALQEKVVKRIREAVEIKSNLIAHRRMLVDEIKERRERSEIIVYQDAAKNLRVQYNLLLIGMVETYVERLQGRIDLLQDGSEELRFLRRQVEDEIKIVHRFHTVENTELLRQIETALSKYEREVEQDLLSTSEYAVPSGEVIWRAICRGQL